MPEVPEPLKCSLHDWRGLNTQLIFTHDGLMFHGGANGSYVRHNELSAWLIRKGTAWLEADGRSFTANAGQWLICTGKHIRQELSADASILSIRVQHSWPNGSPLFSGGPLCLFPAARYPGLEKAAAKIGRQVGKVEWGNLDFSYAYLWQTRIDYTAFMRQQGHLFLWLCELGEALVHEGWLLDIPAGIDSRLAQALFVIDNQDLDKPFPQDEALASSGLTLRQLNRVCEKACGLTTHAYWEKRRTDRAKQALEQGGFQIKEIASSLGFTQLSHFSAWFKRHTGVSPRSYRSRPAKS